MRALAALGAVALSAGLVSCSSSMAVTYVALGDSFTAGPLISAAEPPVGCHRSVLDYPHLVAASIRARHFHDASCSGATTEALTAAQVTSQGVNPPQLEDVDTSTTVVTIGMGGNDIGFLGDVLNCTSLSPLATPCRARYVVAGTDMISARIADVRPRFADALRTIHTRAPRAKVFVIGYPAIVPVTGDGCWPVVPFSAGDVAYIRAKLVELNAMLSSAALENGAIYVDLYSPSAGHDPCAPEPARWVEPFVPMVRAAPLHPNAVGMAAAAALLSGAITAAEQHPGATSALPSAPLQ
jgi:lysophospholipase L1-like esterase